MGTLYIDRKDLYVRLDGDALAFYANGERDGSVPINPLTRVVMVGNITIETSVLNRLAGKDISVLFLSGKRTTFCGMLHGKLHNNGLLRVKQYEKSLSGNFCIKEAAESVTRKISAQKDLLEQARDRRPDLRFELTTAMNSLQGIITQIKDRPAVTQDDDGRLLDSLRGLEGGASAAYFSAYTKMFPDSLSFNKRNRRPPEDPVNAVLSLCYTLVHFDIVREIEVIGLDPVIGFYHQFDYGRESLACDLIEPYRPRVDTFVWEIFRERTFTSRDFAMNDERPGCYLKKESRKRFYPLYEEWVQKARPQWAEDVRVLARRIMDGQDTVYKSYE